MAKEITEKEITPADQAGDILLILDREKLLLQAVAKTDTKGKIKTVPPTDEHNNDFLRLTSDNWLESFATNFFNQLKDPTKFTLIRIPSLKNDLAERAIRDIERGKITKTVVRFLEKYQINPDENHQINPNKMAKKETEQPTTVEQQTPPRYRYNAAMIDWKQVEAHGLSKDQLEKMGLLESLMKGAKPEKLITINAEVGGTNMRYEARIALRQEDDGRVILQTHPLRQAPDFGRPFLGHIFSEDDKINLSKTGNMGRVVPLKTLTGYEDCFISVDRLTNQIVAAKVEGAYIGDEYSKVQLTEQEKSDLREGKAIFVEGMTSKAGKEFSATLQYNADRRGVEYIFPKMLTLEYGQVLGKVPLSKKQVDDYNSGKAILVENMVGKSGEQFTSFVKRDDVSGRASYSRVNPDNSTDIIVPSQINGVAITSEERQRLREGGDIYLNNMTSAKGEDFSSYVKLNMSTGYPMYSKTLEGFDEKRAFNIPQEVFGVTLSATQRANLQDGKAVLIDGMTGYNGEKFAQWAQVNKQGTKLNWFNENPDIKRDTTTRSVMQAAIQQPERASKRGIR